MREYGFGNEGSILKDVENNEYIPFMKDISLSEFSVVTSTGVGVINCIYADPYSDYLFVGNGGYILKIKGSSRIDFSAGDTIYAIVTDADYVYANCGSMLRKFNKTTMAVVGTYDHTGTFSASTIEMDNDYLYIGVGAYVKKISKATMTVVSTSTVFSGNIYGICVLGNYVYSCGATSKQIYKLNRSDLSIASGSANFTGATTNGLASVQTDGVDVFVLVYYQSGTIMARLNADTLAIIAQTTDTKFYSGFAINGNDLFTYPAMGDYNKLYVADKASFAITGSGTTIAGGVTYKAMSLFTQLIATNQNGDSLYCVAHTGAATDNYVVLKTVKKGFAIEGYRKV